MTNPAPQAFVGTDDGFADRVLTSALATLDLLTIALGDRLGYYRALADHGPLTAAELAMSVEANERYTREWLEQQAVANILRVHDCGDAAAERRYALQPGAIDVLVDSASLGYLAPLARQLTAAAQQVPALIEAYRRGDGVPWAAFGVDMRESEADLNRPAYEQLLATQWLPALPDVDRRLRSEPSARVADIGCGAGWSTIALARGYPRVRVDGYDLDQPSVDLANANVYAAGLSDRVRIHCGDIGEVVVGECYDLVTMFECLHDLPHPVAALAAMRAMTGTAGSVVVADMRVADDFTAPGDDIERLMYGFSTLICLPDSMSTPGSAASGTVLRRNVVHDYATRAGYSRVEESPIDHDLWRFYRLYPGPNGDGVSAADSSQRAHPSR